MKTKVSFKISLKSIYKWLEKRGDIEKVQKFPFFEQNLFLARLCQIQEGKSNQGYLDKLSSMLFSIIQSTINYKTKYFLNIITPIFMRKKGMINSTYIIMGL